MPIATPPSSTQWQAAEMARSIESVRRWLDDPEPSALVWTPSLELLAAVFELSSFEAEVLLVCAAVELDSGVASTIAKFQGGDCIHITFGLALSRLRDPHWEALAPHAPLRRWSLVSVGTGQTLLTSPLRIDERILHFLRRHRSFRPSPRSLHHPRRTRPALGRVAPDHRPPDRAPLATNHAAHPARGPRTPAQSAPSPLRLVKHSTGASASGASTRCPIQRSWTDSSASGNAKPPSRGRCSCWTPNE